MSGGRRGRRLWMKIQAHGGTIPVYVVKSIEGKAEGLFDRDVPEILVTQSDNVALMKQALHHEILHVCFSGHSETSREHVLGESTIKRRDDREETLISFLEPVQFDLLVRNGFLKYPNPPRVK